MSRKKGYTKIALGKVKNVMKMEEKKLILQNRVKSTSKYIGNTVKLKKKVDSVNEMLSDEFLSAEE